MAMWIGNVVISTAFIILCALLVYFISVVYTSAIDEYDEYSIIKVAFIVLVLSFGIVVGTFVTDPEHFGYEKVEVEHEGN